jgi:membrane-associated phospholipid phosphatase
MEHRPHMILNRRRVMIIALCMLGAAAMLTFLVAFDPTYERVQSIDDWVHDWINAHRSDALTNFFKTLTDLGGGKISWAVRIAVIVVLLIRHRYLQTAAFLTAIVLSELCVGPLKVFIDRARPPDLLVDVNGASYPSGHSVAIAVTAIGIVIALFPPGRARLRWELIAAAFTFLVALSRVYINAHWMTDAIGGSLIGSGWALLCPAVFEEVRYRRRGAALYAEATAGEGLSPDVPSGVDDARRI